VSVPEAELSHTPEGAVVESDGWFVLNLADARAHRHPKTGVTCTFEGAEARFPEFGVNVRMLEPGQPSSLYHAESAQEAFLVLSGECLLVVEEQERTLRAWDFFYCPPHTRHAIVGAGEGPCAVLMVGARPAEKRLNYPVSELAGAYGASASEATELPWEAYRDWSPEFSPERMPWPPPGA
jgi:uncharacterized cupin superfamily protein